MTLAKGGEGQGSENEMLYATFDRFWASSLLIPSTSIFTNVTYKLVGV